MIPVHQFKRCARCAAHRAPEGGVTSRTGQWVCLTCWMHLIGRRKVTPYAKT